MQKLGPEWVKHTTLVQSNHLFTTFCGSCHKLYGARRNRRQDPTGTGSQNLDNLLEIILFPSVLVSADFCQTTITRKDSRVLSGVIRSSDAKSVI